MSAPLPDPAPSAPDDDTAEVRFELEGVAYTLDRPPRRHGRRSVATVRLVEHDTDPGFTDRVDLYASQSRRAFARRVADAFGRRTDEVLGHLAVILDTTERRERAAQTGASERTEEPTAERRDGAEALLARPDLLERAAQTMERLGYVGEERTKRLAYLVATSRLLARPLSAILTAPSGCGKSELLDVTAELLPPEETEPLSRLTPQALYYAGAHHLRHKLVLVDEQAGATEADHSIRTLQSKGLLRLAVPTQGKTEPVTVHGPIALMSGTTSADLNPENLSRCLELTLDDSPAQTRRIQAAQRRAWSGAASPASAVDVTPWRDAQRLLTPGEVVIPYAERLSYPARTPHDRRGHQQLLGLTAAHALLCQARRERDASGRVVATPADYRAVHDLLRPAVDEAIADLSPRAARAYRLLLERGEPLTRRELARAFGWAYNTAKKALAELTGQELALEVARGGPPARYRLLERVGAEGAGLLDPAELDEEVT